MSGSVLVKCKDHYTALLSDRNEAREGEEHGSYLQGLMRSSQEEIGLAGQKLDLREDCVWQYIGLLCSGDLVDSLL